MKSLQTALEQLVELIDTLWNVNTFRKAWFSIVNIELIDTLWNVN